MRIKPPTTSTPPPASGASTTAAKSSGILSALRNVQLRSAKPPIPNQDSRSAHTSSVANRKISEASVPNLTKAQNTPDMTHPPTTTSPTPTIPKEHSWIVDAPGHELWNEAIANGSIIVGEAAHSQTGVHPSHFQGIQTTVDTHNVGVSIRNVNPLSTDLIGQGYPTKDMSIKAKSATSGPAAGFIELNQRHRNLSAADAGKYRAEAHASIANGQAKPVTLTITQDRLEQLLNNQGLGKHLSTPLKLDHGRFGDGRLVLSSLDRPKPNAPISKSDDQTPTPIRFTYTAFKNFDKQSNLWDGTYSIYEGNITKPDPAVGWQVLSPVRSNENLGVAADYDIHTTFIATADRGPEDNIRGSISGRFDQPNHVHFTARRGSKLRTENSVSMHSLKSSNSKRSDLPKNRGKEPHQKDIHTPFQPSPSLGQESVSEDFSVDLSIGSPPKEFYTRRSSLLSRTSSIETHPASSTGIRPTSPAEHQARRESWASIDQRRQSLASSAQSTDLSLSDPEKGNVSKRDEALIIALNESIDRSDNPAFHHGSDAGNPNTNAEDNFPVTVFLPKAVAPVGGEVIVVKSESAFHALRQLTNNAQFPATLSPHWDNPPSARSDRMKGHWKKPTDL